MVATILFSISALSFISSFGCYLCNRNISGNFLSSIIPSVSAFILAVIPERLIFNIAWIWIFMLNVIVVYNFSTFIAKLYLKSVPNRKNFYRDSINATIIGLITLFFGLIFFFLMS